MSIPDFLRELRYKVAEILLPEEVAKLNLSREAFLTARTGTEQATELLTKERRDYAAWAERQTVVSVVRRQLAGFDPKLLDEERDLPEVLGDVDEQDSFLAKCVSLKNDRALATILAYLKRNQVMHTAKEAQTLDAINFGRATINGLSLLEEEIARLATIHAERHPPEEKFDAHEVV